MQQLTIIERTMERSLPPQVRDVQKILLARERLMMFERSVVLGNVMTSTTGPVYGAVRITLDSLPDYTECTALFDAYRILQATVTFFPSQGMPPSTTTSSLFTVIDYDDDTNLSSIGGAMEYPSCMQSVAGSIVERTFNPVAANAAYAGTFTSYARMPRTTWVDAGSPGVRYYGLKWAIDTNTTAITLWTISLRVILQCKNVR